MSKAKRTALCAYCGELSNITRDHVIPKCLFVRPLPSNPLTVPACAKCNNRKSKHDDFLRDLLVSDIATDENSIARQLFKEKTVRSFEHGKSLVSRIALSDSKPMPILNTEGQLDVAYVSSFDPARASEMFEFIVRGLFFSAFDFSLSLDTKISARRHFKSDVDRIIEIFNQQDVSGRMTVGEGVFSCIYIHGSESPEASVWFLEFFDSVQYSIFTTPIGFGARTEF